jgi:DNA-binding NarL/FixJ family response regulator
MRLMALGGSNSEIAKECNVSEKAVERTVSAASKLLEVIPASSATNHRVNAANKYLKALFYSEALEL